MLKLYNKATTGQKFLAFIVDGIIISTFAIGLSALIFLLIGFNYSAYMAARNEMLTNYLLYAAYGGNYEQSLSLALNEYNKFSLVFYPILDSMYLVVIIVYLVIIPQFWEKQTVGRMLLKIKVIGRIGDVKAGYKRTIIREVAGTWLFYVVSYSFISAIVIIISGIIILISGRGIPDRISGTDMVQDLPLNIDPNSFKEAYRFDSEEANQFKPNPNEFRREDTIDAEVVDLDKNQDNNHNNNDDSDDDEYQIF